MTRVAVIGATGYVGSELCRWVLQHPRLDLACVVSTSRAGDPLVAAVPGLLGATDLVLQPFDAAELSKYDVVAFATPHGAAKPLIEQLGNRPLILDCSSDHRHARGWVFGQPEWQASALAGATRISAPGCFATAMMMSLAPFQAVGAIAGSVQVCAATGSAGSGAKPKQATHHPERFANLKAYKVLRHQHVPEVRTFLGMLGHAAPQVNFVPVSAPLDRGIFATSFIPVAPGTNALELVEQAYLGARFVRIREGTPEVRHVRGTPYIDLSVHQDGDLVVMLAAVCNLGRGAAAQAVQALNIALGWPEDTGLSILPCTP